jgi:hypothetical protein
MGTFAECIFNGLFQCVGPLGIQSPGYLKFSEVFVIVSCDLHG